MRIAYNAVLLRPGEYSGVQVAIRELLRGLVRTCPGDAALTVYARRDLPADVLPDGAACDIRRAGRLARWRAGRIAWERLRLPFRAAAGGADLLHGPGYVLPRVSPLPTVASVHDVFALIAPGLCTRANRGYFARALPPTLRSASLLAVPTAAVRRDLLRWAAAEGASGSGAAARWRMDPAGLERKIRVIPWGVAPQWRPATADECADAALRLNLPERFFLVVARPEPKKNLSTALRGWFAGVHAGGLPHRLVLAGPKGWGVEKGLREAAANLGVADRILRLGFVDAADLRALYSLADGLLMPSWSEGFGLPALEAMACGCPVAAAEIPALLEVAGRGNALFARPDDLPAWRGAVEKLGADAGLRAELAQAGRRRAAAFTWDECARRYWELYREALSLR